MYMKILIIEDEELAVKKIKKLVKYGSASSRSGG